jgi:CRP/FNR family cyclic AMP-dependent transcriptional regulator
LLAGVPSAFRATGSLHVRFTPNSGNPVMTASVARQRLEAQRLHVLLAALEQYSVQSIEQRLASRLLMLAGPYGVSSAQGLKIELHLPQETLAQLVGVTRQRINQILKDWQREGLIDHQYGQITLLDEARFEKLSQ